MARTPLFQWMSRMVRRAMAEADQPTHPLKPESASESDSINLAAPMSRRAFLKTMIGAAGTVASVSIFPSISSSAAGWAASAVSPETPSSAPVIIAGAGLGGLVTAYRLTQMGIPCELYEAGRRPGGRVFTRRNFNSQGMFVELGGELVDTGHEDLIALCGELNVPLERFEEAEAGIAPALYFSGGKVHTEVQVLQAFKPLAETLAKDIRICFPDGEIQIPTFQAPYNAKWMDDLNLEAYLNTQKNVDAWLIRLIKAAYTGEYGLDPSEQSALNLLLLIGTDSQSQFRMFGESDEAMRIQNGNSMLVSALVAALENKVPIHYGYRLNKISDKHGALHLSFKSERQMIQRTPDRAVLAIPFSVLRTVDGIDELTLSPVKRRCIQEWGYGTNSKQIIGFHSRFWRSAYPVSSGASVSVVPSSGELFTDLPSQCYWETSRLQAGNSGILTNFLGGKAGREAARTQWQLALKDLALLYPEVQDETDNNRAFFNWFRNPYAKGSYSCPKPGQYTRLMGAAGLPELDGRLFFAGEHCSVDWAGFMNGAVQSGNVAALQISGRKAVLGNSTIAVTQKVPIGV